MKRNIFLICLFVLFVTHIATSQSGNFNEYSYTCLDKVDRPYITYTPKNLIGDNQKSLLVYLHGAISNKNLKKDPLDYIKKSKLVKLAEKGGFHLMFCYGQQGASWFDSVGVEMVLGAINEVRKTNPVDDEKIYLSGFSDGGSGALYFSMVHPEKFAGFITMN